MTKKANDAAFKPMIHFARWQYWLIAAVCAAGVLAALPNVLNSATLDRLPAFVPHKTINLGLDLRGGSHVLLDVGVDEVVNRRLVSLGSDIRGALAGAEPRIGYSDVTIGDRRVSFRLLDRRDIGRARMALHGLGSGLEVHVAGARFAIGLDAGALRKLKDDTVAHTIAVIRRRIDELGLREATVQRHGDRRIIVEIPGMDNPRNVLDIIGPRAVLSFHRLCSADPFLRGPQDVPAGCVRLEAVDGIDKSVAR